MSDDRSKELVTDENFNAYAYILANPDVAAANVPPREHFNNFGRAEGREQYAYFPKKRDEKYRRLKGVLKAPFDGDKSGTFPIFTSAEHFKFEDYANESANPPYDDFTHVVEANPSRIYLDIGCGFREKVYDNCLCVEVYPSRSADLIVSPDCTYPIRDGSIDGNGCFAVLEHTRKPWIVVQEMIRMLKSDGIVWINWPFLQPVHGYPSRFFNATREGLTSIFEDAGFTIVSANTRPNQTPAYTMRWILGVMAHRIEDPGIRAEFEALTLKELIAFDPLGPEWARYLGAISPDAVSELSAGNFLVATKI